MDMAKEKKIRYIVEIDVLLETFQLHILETRFKLLVISQMLVNTNFEISLAPFFM